MQTKVIEKKQLKNYTNLNMSKKMEELIEKIIKKNIREELEKMGIKPTKKNMYTVAEAASYLGYEISYMYQLNTRKEISYYKPNGGKVYYNKTDLDAWLDGLKEKSKSEIISSIDNKLLYHHKLR